MTFSIDSTSRNKAAAYPVNHGYELRTAMPTSIIVHDTEGPVGQSLQSASLYLYATDKVSAHYLIGRAGEIIQYLDPRTYAAWHAGVALTAYNNQHSIGIECLHAKGDAWTPVQKAALAWLLSYLMDAYLIALTAIDTHGQVALPGPYKRKTDPSDWSHDDFIVWRNALGTPPPPPTAPASLTNASPLIAAPRATQQQCVAAILKHPNGDYTPYDVASIVRSYYAYAAGLDPLIAIAQMCHETGYLSSQWAARPNRNPAGIGVNGVPGQGLVFDSWELAARCHIGRLLAYALPRATGTAGQQVLIDNALALRGLPAKDRGSAPTLGGLNGKWAPSASYSDRIIEIANVIMHS